MYQRLLAQMTCPRCHVISTDGTTTDMQVKFGLDDLYLRVGDRIPRRFDQLAGTFQIIRPVPAPFIGRALVAWYCPACQTPDQWAIVELQPEGDCLIVKSIEAVERTVEVAATVDAVSNLVMLTGTWPI